MQDKRIKRILLISIILGFVLSVSSLFFYDAKYFSGVLAGSIIGSVNFCLWVLVVQKMIGDNVAKGGLALRFLLKYGLLAAMISVTLIVFKIEIIGFAVGISNLVIAVVIGGVGEFSDPE